MKRLLTISCALLYSGACAQEIFHSIAIYSPDGMVATFPIAQVDSVTFSREPSVQQCKWYHTLESPGIADYLRDFEYDATDYSYHRIFDYRGAPYLDARQDWPYGVTLGDTTYYNLIPGRQYTLQPKVDGVLQTPISITTLGQLRMIRAEGIDNVRDLGGWPTASGQQLRYGLIYRGTELDTRVSPTHASLRSAHQITEADRSLFLDQLGVRAELDLRSSSEIPSAGHSALGATVEYLNVSFSSYADISSAEAQRQALACLRFIIDQLSKGHPVYLHCVWGADRTGILCLLLEGLLGLRQTDLDKDYELTSFCGNTRYRTNTKFTSALRFISPQGTTTQAEFRNWWLNAGATSAELDLFVSLMK